MSQPMSPPLCARDDHRIFLGQRPFGQPPESSQLGVAFERISRSNLSWRSHAVDG
jgi:hypothetical protein